ncbi:DinB family protein [candidate division KSB1 bacterium]|nr:DinB family protein [candidate division KSB1 bacterium]NIV69629.1 hypothetical protein [Phycisphaerae bacterium]NIR70370.1 DinB family protein [candidate division KSB1 bacterium]NIS24493.1 DinB family protein [candidate division KSB1 bacterium]NIT71421.1 DinB family protein [candidate division KSB1 bacterium]
MLIDGMSEQQLRRSPHPEVNPILWILWHTRGVRTLALIV